MCLPRTWGSNEMDPICWETLQPKLAKGARGELLLAEVVEQLSRVDPYAEGGIEALQRVRRGSLDQALHCGAEVGALRVCISVLCDLRGQGWNVRVNDGAVQVGMPLSIDDPVREKARIRAGLLVERDQQLREPAVRRFVSDMERRRPGPSGDWVSIFSLMRDGAALARELRGVRNLASEGDRATALDGLIRPYIQVVDDSRCPHTGLHLKDVWRYFRHTWASPHKTLPGRTVWLLVRDAAVKYHPVVGIAALGSAVVQLLIRDNWIGWAPDEFIARLRAQPSNEWATWLDERLTEQLQGVYYADFLEKGILDEPALETPCQRVVDELRAIATDAREVHRQHGTASEHKDFSAIGETAFWELRARTHLFTSKRAATLADILEDRIFLRRSGFVNATSVSLAAALKESRGRKAIRRTLRRVKAAHVGIDMLDITVCGAIPPYSHLLGGKLVSLLLASPEVRSAYQVRYGGRSSVIASSMAGASVKRAPRLVLLGTTSLYGVGSSQYNRLRVPGSAVGGADDAELRYVQLGATEGYGSFHFSSGTLQEIREFFAASHGGRRVKHIFGEGANPRMREIREALYDVGLPIQLLKHGSKRILYVVPLARNFREVLLDQAEDPDYLLSGNDSDGGTEALVRFWVDRWLVRRIEHDPALAAVESQTLDYPVEHGARVSLPSTLGDTPLFAGAEELGPS